MQRAIIAVLALASGSSPAVVRSIGFHQYMVTDAGKQVFARASETCAKLGRSMMPLGIPPEEAGIDFGKQFKFECVLAFEIVPSGQGTYTIHVPTEKMSEKTEHLARAYCAKTHKTMVVTGEGFDMGPGLTLNFKCVPPQQGAPSR